MGLDVATKGSATPAIERRAMPVIAGLMLAMFLTALDTTIVNTALPSIVGNLGGFTLYPWVPSIYLLTTAVSTPIWGKLADLYGRKHVLFAGIAIFFAGSVLSGAAPAMLFLVVARAIQGLGAGAVQPITTTIIGDMFEPEQRARVQGFFSSVWGVSALVGPLSGGLLSEHLSWRWIFYLNVPVVIAAVLLLHAFFVERGVQRRHTVDVRGATLLTLALCAGLLLLLNGGQAWPWLSAPTVVLLLLTACAAALFVRQEQRTPEPVLPLALFRLRVIAIATVVGFCIGMLRIGISYQIPLFVQGVLGQDAIRAGLALAPMSLGWPLAGSVSGRLALRLGYRTVALIGMALCALGVALLLTLGLSSSFLAASLFAFIVGLGLGLSATPVLVSLQSAVSWAQRGVATGTQMFMRNFGSVAGVAITGLIINQTLAGSATGQAASRLLNARARGGLHAAARHAARQALMNGIHDAFLVALIGAVVGLLALLTFPQRVQPEQKGAGAGAAAPVTPARLRGAR